MPKSHIQLLIEEGNLMEAKVELDRYEADESADADIYSIRAVIAVYENDFIAAERYIALGLSLDPQHEDLIYNMGCLQQILNKETIAMRHFQQVIDFSSDSELKLLTEQKIKECSESLQQKKPPLVSIVLLAYNKLNYTKMCVESIYKYTNHIDFEFIVVNNASSDGTREYFDGLPENARPIHLAKNLGAVGGFNEGMKVARGRYTACVCNDFIFTPRWLDNLLTCIESDPAIGYVSPGASYISNFQQINGVYSNIDEMLEFAEQYNHSDPRKWEERVRLMPCVLMARTELLSTVGYYDPGYYYGEFADDDISFRIRRSGYKLVFCRDTFTYHFGSVTVRNDQIHNNSFQVGRDFFKEKFGVDSWLDSMYNPGLLNTLSISSGDYSVPILGINAKCGGNPLQLKNMLKERGINEIVVTNYCLDEKYKADLLTVSDLVVEGQLNEISALLESKTYKYIVLEHSAEVFVKHPELARQLALILEKGGELVISLSYNEIDENSVFANLEVLTQAGIQVFNRQFQEDPLARYVLLITARKGV